MTGSTYPGRQRVLRPGECCVSKGRSLFQGKHSTVAALTPTNGYLNLHPVREVKTHLLPCSPCPPSTWWPSMTCVLSMSGQDRHSVFSSEQGALLASPALGFLRSLFSFPRRGASTVSWQGLGSMHQNLTSNIHPVGEVGPVWPSWLPWQPTHSPRAPPPS